MKSVYLQVPDFDGTFHFNWEQGKKIKINSSGGEIVIVANKNGLLSLANHLVNLAQDDVPNGYHFHLDQFNSLANGSDEVVFVKDAYLEGDRKS